MWGGTADSLVSLAPMAANTTFLHDENFASSVPWCPLGSLFVRELAYVAKLIFDNTGSSQVLVFIGQSGDYVRAAMAGFKKPRKCFVLPYSGHADCIDSHDKVLQYLRNVLMLAKPVCGADEVPGETLLELFTTDRIAFVDHSDKGVSFRQFLP